jgi:hypothetical protein
VAGDELGEGGLVAGAGVALEQVVVAHVYLLSPWGGGIRQGNVCGVGAGGRVGDLALLFDVVGNGLSAGADSRTDSAQSFLPA